MDLQEFIGRRVNVTKLARDIGYSRTHIAQVISGKVKINRRLALLLQHASNGKLNAEELLKKKDEKQSLEVKEDSHLF